MFYFSIVSKLEERKRVGCLLHFHFHPSKKEKEVLGILSPPSSLTITLTTPK